MESKDAVKLLEDMAMSVLEHTFMKNAELIMEGDNRKPDAATAAKMKEIKAHAKETLARTVSAVLTELLERQPTTEEIRGVTFVLDNPEPPYLKASRN